MTTRKTSIVIALCFVLIGTLTATKDVTAASTDDSAFRRFDIAIGDYKYGELTIDPATDQFFAIANVGKGSAHECVTLVAVSYTHLRAHETRHDLVCRLLL